MKRYRLHTLAPAARYTLGDLISDTVFTLLLLGALYGLMYAIVRIALWLSYGDSAL